MTEEELARRCAHGDNEARRELYMTYSSRIRALCLRYAENAAEAEDMMQDAFIKIFHVIGRFVWTREGSLYSWMARVALNNAFDSTRKRKRLVREIMDVEALTGDVVDEPDYDETASIPFDVLQAMVEELPEGARTIFKLFCIEGLSHKEIATILGIREKSSSSCLAKARTKLARVIKKYLEEQSRILDNS